MHNALDNTKENMNNIIAESKYNRNYTDEGIKCTSEEKRTKQSFSEDCDINKILERFAKTGQLPEQRQKQYGDFSSVPDYMTAFNIVQNAHDQFDSLDAKVRARFNNDPSAFLDFATNSENHEEMIKLGLAPKPPLNTSTEPPKAQESVSTVPVEVKK